MTERSLSLKREPLTELTADELSAVAGGATQLCGPWQKLSDKLDCHSWQCTR